MVACPVDGQLGVTSLARNDGLVGLRDGIVTISINPESFRDQLTELMRRPVRVIGGEVLRRISKPSSPLHSDYLAGVDRASATCRHGWRQRLHRSLHLIDLGNVLARPQLPRQ